MAVNLERAWEQSRAKERINIKEYLGTTCAMKLNNEIAIHRR